MSQLKTITIKNKNGEAVAFQFYCDFKSYNYGFAHIAKMYKNYTYKKDGEEYLDSAYINTGRASWINRTWECWTYQTACKNAVHNEIDELKERIKRYYMDAQGFKKITAKRRAGLEAEYNNSESLYLYNELLKALNNNCY